jgi:leucyl aminopeptidase
VVLFVCEDKPLYTHAKLRQLAANSLDFPEFKGRPNETLVLPAAAPSEVSRLICCGLGPCAEVEAETLRAAAGKAVSLAIDTRLEHLLLAVPAAGALGKPLARLVEVIGEGAVLANHLYQDFKSEPDKAALKQIDCLLPAAQQKRFKALPKQLITLARGTQMAREWVSLPANRKRPAQLATKWADLARRMGLTVKTWGPGELKKNNMDAVLAVCQGSRSQPRMLFVEPPPKGRKGPKVVLIGKGVTFDTGGYNLKTSASIAEMKADMAGGAAVMATVLTAHALKLPIQPIGVIPLVENMVSGSAIRPGDIISTHAGKTVEIGNTDAEGRLILADALAYAQKAYQPDVIIDVATLTGACVVALGEQIAGLFSPDDRLANQILDAAQHTHERCWRMPLPEDYLELLKSPIADINNMPSKRWGAAITAALFLATFVDNPRWAHVDIAGPAFSKQAGPYCRPGGTGFGVRLLIDTLRRLAA